MTPEELAPLRAVLREHYLMQVTCDHEGKRDNPVCNCQRVNLGWHPSIGAAVDAWTDHVLAAAREALARPGGGQERDELIAMAVDTADRDECQLVISEMLARIATGRTITAKEAEDWRARAGLGDGHG